MRIVAVTFAVLLMVEIDNSHAALEISADSAVSNTGYFRLSWSDDSSADSVEKMFVLQQADDPDFSNPVDRYQGGDAATVISGLSNQIYYYRVRELNYSQWSNSVSVEVKHHSLSRAFGFFALGIAMFAVTVTVLLRGARQYA